MGVYKRGKRYWISYSRNGHVVRESVGTTNEQIAERALAVRRQQVALGSYGIPRDLDDVGFTELSEDYMNYAMVNKRSHKRDGQLVSHLKGFFNDTSLSAITPQMVEKYKAERMQKVSKATVNRELACLSCMINLAIKWGRTFKNPVKEVRLFKEAPYEMKILSREEERWLVDSAADHLKPIILTALNTGMRLGEILNLTWDRMDISRGVITVTRTKNSEVRRIPMNQLLKQLFTELRRNKKGNYVFSHPDGTPFGKVSKGFVIYSVINSCICFCRGRIYPTRKGGLDKSSPYTINVQIFNALHIEQWRDLVSDTVASMT